MSENCSYHVDGCLLAFAAGTLIGAGNRADLRASFGQGDARSIGQADT